MEAKVSIVIPAYNGALFLDKAIQSIDRQSYPVYEIIVVDDGSTDNTPQVLAKYADRIHVKRIPNGGGANATNVGLQMATGDFVALLDQDDIWFRDKIARQVEMMLQYPRVGLCACNFSTRMVYGGRIRMVKRFSILRNRERMNYDAPLENALEIVLNENFIGTMSTVLIRRSVLDEVGLLNTDYRICYDYDYWLRCLMITEFGVVPDVLIHKTTHANNVSANSLRMSQEHDMVLTSFIGHAFFQSEHMQFLLRREVSRQHYKLGNAYFDEGKPVQAFRNYWRGLAAHWRIPNVVRFLRIVAAKIIRSVSFNLIRRRDPNMPRAGRRT